jgi:hypothetical protein
MTHVGSCFCGAVRIEAEGAPEAMGYCHCRSCRSGSGGTVIAFSRTRRISRRRWMRSGAMAPRPASSWQRSGGLSGIAYCHPDDYGGEIDIRWDWSGRAEPGPVPDQGSGGNNGH